eukprot:TRINITY_DN597_c0_g1_i1.p2 TRINITY_DN597_c0_g1~~TRINITY_DN597_c0_g1_i1.p2  ORF type:complete len:63 (+),score=6.43 TRINITY_DN597_c0_g1_i1:220-408(+)
MKERLPQHGGCTLSRTKCEKSATHDTKCEKYCESTSQQILSNKNDVIQVKNASNLSKKNIVF